MSQVKVNVKLPKVRIKDERKHHVNVIKNLAHLLKIVENRNLSHDLEEEVKRQICSFPEGSLEFAYNNLEKIINNSANALVDKNKPPVFETPPPKEEVLESRKALFDE